MENKYIATLMLREYKPTGAFTFTCQYVITGDYDEETQTFVDAYGNEYYDMVSDNAVNLANESNAVYHIKKIEDMMAKDEYKDNTVEYMICDYYDDVETKFYIIGNTDDGTRFLREIDLADLREEAKNIQKGISNTPTPSLKSLQQIIFDVEDGKYTIPQMLQMRKNLEVLQDLLENTMGTIENKIGALNENKTLAEYINDQIEKDNRKALPSGKKNSVVSARDIGLKIAQEKKKEKEIQQKPAAVEQAAKEARFSIKKIVEDIERTIIAQDEPIKRLVTEFLMMILEPEKRKYAIMITGATGTGKTKTMECLAERLGRKLFIVDTGPLSKAGYTGKDVEQVLYELYEFCGRDIKTAENSIIYLDEIDKKGSSKKDDVSGQAVLNILLKLIEGSVYDATRDLKTASEVVKIDTKNIIVVVGGAFTDVLETLRNNTMGFDRENALTNEKVELDKEAFIKEGMMPREFMGRMKIIKFNDLTQEDIKRILEESDSSVLKLQQKVFKDVGVELKYTEGYTRKVAEKAYKMKTGARGLEDIVSSTTWQAFAEVSEPDDAGLYKSVTITEETVEDNTKYIVEKNPKYKKVEEATQYKLVKGQTKKNKK